MYVPARHAPNPEPIAFLKGKLVGQEPPLPMMSATHADEMKNPAEFWAAIGNRMRRSYHATRCGDVCAVLKPYYLPGGVLGTGTTHGGPFDRASLERALS